jgi:hypothetical protein
MNERDLRHSLEIPSPIEPIPLSSSLVLPRNLYASSIAGKRASYLLSVIIALTRNRMKP